MRIQYKVSFQEIKFVFRLVLSEMAEEKWWRRFLSWWNRRFLSRSQFGSRRHGAIVKPLSQTCKHFNPFLLQKSTDLWMLGSPTIKLLFAYIWHFPFNKHMLHILKSLIYASISTSKKWRSNKYFCRLKM